LWLPVGEFPISRNEVYRVGESVVRGSVLGVAGNSPGTMPANGDVGRHTHEEHLYEYGTTRDLARHDKRLAPGLYVAGSVAT